MLDLPPPRPRILVTRGAIYERTVKLPGQEDGLIIKMSGLVPKNVLTIASEGFLSCSCKKYSHRSTEPIDTLRRVGVLPLLCARF